MELHSEDYAFSQEKMRLPGTRLGRLLRHLAHLERSQSEPSLLFEGEQIIRVRGVKN